MKRNKAEKKAQARGYGFVEEEEEDDSESDSGDEGMEKVSNERAPAVLPGFSGGFPTPAAASVLQSAAAKLSQNLGKIQATAMPEHYKEEFEINDYPQNVRWKVTHKETLGPISEWTGAAITTKGKYYPPRMNPRPEDERKLYLCIEGPTDSSVKKAMVELQRVANDVNKHPLSLPSASQQGRYSVLPKLDTN